MKAKIHWRESEKALVTKRAVDLLLEDPSLTGLRLLNEAQKALPTDRRRSLSSLAQADWFEPALAIEAKTLRSNMAAATTTAPEPAIRLVDHPDDPYLPAIREYVAVGQTIKCLVLEVIARQEVCTSAVLEMTGVLKILASEMKVMNGHLGGLISRIDGPR